MCDRGSLLFEDFGRGFLRPRRGPSREEKRGREGGRKGGREVLFLGG